MPHLTPIQTARAIAKLEENWPLAAVARELHCSKTCIFNIKANTNRCWKGFFSKVYFHFNNVLITSQPHFYFLFFYIFFIFFIFFLPFPFHLTGLSGTFYGRLGFFFLCGAAGLRGTFPGYLRPPSLLSFFWTTQLLSLIFIKNYLLQLFIIKIVTPAARTPMNTV
jgi:hypothetical protein